MNILRPISMGALRFFSKLMKQKQIYKTQAVLSDNSFKKYSLMTFVSIAFLWPMKKAQPIDNKKYTEMLNTLLKTADNLFQNGHYEDSYAVLSDWEEPDNVEVQWRLVRVLYNMSKEPKYEDSYKKELIDVAYDIISKLLLTHDDHYAVHKWYALLLDTKSASEGIKERIRQLENVKKHMDLAVTLNPDDATTLHMLGEWCYQIAEMPWHQRKIAEVLFATPPQSTYEDALEYFLRAETVQPRFYSLNLLRLGSCYLKLEKEDQAKYYLKLAASYPAKSNDDHQATREAADLLKRMSHHGYL